MIRVVGSGSRDCDRITRRSFVQAGLLGAGGLMLGDYLSLSAHGAERPVKRDTSVILFWLSGGPGHMETYDPKPDAPAEFRGPLKAIATRLPGVQFAELVPEQARRLDQLAVIRTVNHGSGDHTKGNHWMLTGFEGPAFNAPDNTQQRRPALGSAVAKLRGANRPGLLPYVAVPHLRGLIDESKKRVGSGIVAIVGVTEDGKAGLAVGVTDDLTKTWNAVELVKIGAEALGGKGGGGRPDMAQAGGPDGTKASAALEAIEARLSA